MPGPRNASIDARGFRMYEWTEDGVTHRLLSVTSIRKLTGVSHILVEWQLSNLTKLAMGIRKQTVIGPRGGVKEVYVKDGPFPGEFARRLMETDGEQKKLDEVRKWLRSAADEPRDVPAVRGSVVHKLIELNVSLDRLSEEVIRHRFDEQWRGERRKVVPDVTADDVNFVFNGMRQYWDLRARHPFVVIAREPQVFHLEAGYSGSADVLVWFLPESEAERLDYWQNEATRARLTWDTILKVGGETALGDWKTSKGVYTDHVIQSMAYLGAEFVGADGVRDERLTAILEGTMRGMLVHIRPDGWAIDKFEWSKPVMRAFLGSVAFARFLAANPRPDGLFVEALTGSADGTESSQYVDEDAA